MTKKELANILYLKEVFDTKLDAEKKIDSILDLIQETLLSGEDVNFIGWGKLEVVQRAPRLGRNPKTGEEVQIDSRRGIKFKPGKKFLEKLN
ncbi:MULTISPECIES: HU family DNA-binding protein [Fusobacterium]|uniref:HU family DNA-binding protein n=1 Tax=Fusobacterium TaxID=848 RepID=UPI0015A62052|nr:MULTISPECIES: HU family DNA-binding protein [Fusobacterium]MCF2612671.1 HU family DNA-binding protein [Fusobacterium perfoetens]MDY2980436.1 HU family DNA-binding protein [Fusobacterium sp.]